MHVAYGLVSDKIADKYNCLHDFISIDPTKLMKELTKIEDKLKSTKTTTDLCKHGQVGPPSEVQTPKDNMTVPISRKAPKHLRDIVILSALQGIRWSG